MKKMNLLLCMAGMFASLLLSCDKESNDPNFPVEFELQLLNSDGEISTDFKEGEPITFRFTLTNTTDEKVNLTNFVPALICKPDNSFFRVYQEIPVQKDWGRVCMPPNCTYEGQFPIEANETRIIEYTWPNNNSGCTNDIIILPKGTYHTGFEHVFEANGKDDGLSSKQSFSTTFRIE